MKLAVMSDVHANPKALETALADARGQGCERFVMLGDVTGYGYDAKTALDVVRGAFDAVLMGNHDSACAGLEPEWEVLANHNYGIDRAERETLAESDIEWLASRGYVCAECGAAFAHGNFEHPSSWGYIISPQDAARSLAARAERLLFCGHTHHAAVWELDGLALRARFEKRLFRPVGKAESVSLGLAKGRRYVINVGSVGYPRVDLCSTYAIWDTDRDRVAIRRLPFDFKSYVDEMLSRRIDLPLWLVDLLMSARG